MREKARNLHSTDYAVFNPFGTGVRGGKGRGLCALCLVFTPDISMYVE